MARRRGRGFIRPAPRTKMWIGAGVGSTTLSANSKHLVAQLSAGALLLRPFTILRTHLYLALKSDQVAANEDPGISLGMIVVTDAASAVGVTAIPDPDVIAGNPEADWFVHGNMRGSFAFLSAVGFDESAQTELRIDSKAMRKVGPDDDVVLMATEIFNHGAILTTMGRRLIQLH